MFVDQIKIYAKAGDGGNGVVRWRHEKFKPRSGPAGGDGGNGGNIIFRAVRDVNLLAKYTGSKAFSAESGEAGQINSKTGKNGQDLVIEVPVGSIIKDKERERVYEFLTEGQEEIVFKGGRGGFGNEHFKSFTNRSPEEFTEGKAGEEGELEITLSLVVDLGLIGFPNAGKSSLLNTLTRAKSKIGDYPFTTLEPHLGDFFGYVIADIPGLIIGASEGKGLGHTFLRHVSHTKMLLHLVSLEEDEKTPLEKYLAIRKELESYDEELPKKEEWVILTKTDLVTDEKLLKIKSELQNYNSNIYAISILDDESIKNFKDNLFKNLKSKNSLN